MSINDPLPTAAAADVLTRYDLERVIILAVSGDGSTVHTVTYGASEDLQAMAALDAGKVRAMLAGEPDSLEEAVDLARKFRESLVGMDHSVCPTCGSQWRFD